MLLALIFDGWEGLVRRLISIVGCPTCLFSERTSESRDLWYWLYGADVWMC